MQYTFTAVYLPGENGEVVAYLEELPGAHGQGATIEEADESLRDATEMVLAANRRFTHTPDQRGGGTLRSLQIFRAISSFTSRWRGIVERRPLGPSQTV